MVEFIFNAADHQLTCLFAGKYQSESCPPVAAAIENKLLELIGKPIPGNRPLNSSPIICPV